MMVVKELLIRMRIQRSKIGGTFFVKNVPPNPLHETSIIAGSRISCKEIRLPASAKSS